MIFAPLLVTALVLIVFIILEALIDTIRGRRFKAVTNHLLEIGKRHSLTTVSVVVREQGPRQQVIELLEHLRSFGYDRLQVVVVPKSRDTKRTQYLSDYRATHRDLNIRIVRSGGHRDTKMIAQRHARGELLLWLAPDDRLSSRFFEFASYEFANPAIDRVDIPYRYETARTISDLLATWSLIRRETLELIHRKKSQYRHPIYRRAVIKHGSQQQTAVKAGTPLSFIRPREAPIKLNLLVIFGNLLVAAALGYAMLYYLNTEWLFTVLAIVSAYLLSNFFWLVSSKRYTLPEAVPLVLALPFAIAGNFAAHFKRG